MVRLSTRYRDTVYLVPGMSKHGTAVRSVICQHGTRLDANMMPQWAAPYVQDWSAQNFVRDERVVSSTLLPAQTNPTPDLTVARTPRLGGSRSARAVTRLRRVFWWRFPEHQSGQPGGQPRPKIPASCTKFSAHPFCA